MNVRGLISVEQHTQQWQNAHFFQVDMEHLLKFNHISLVAQLVKIPPAMQETWVRSRVGKIPEKGPATTHYSGWEFIDCIVYGV